MTPMGKQFQTIENGKVEGKPTSFTFIHMAITFEWPQVLNNAIPQLIMQSSVFYVLCALPKIHKT